MFVYTRRLSIIRFRLFVFIVLPALILALTVAACGPAGGSGAGGGVSSVVRAETTSAADGTYTLSSFSHGTGTSTISGKVEYVDRIFDSTGFTGTTTLPVRFARVQAVESGGAITVRALTQTNSGSSYEAAVKDNRNSSVYAVVTSDLSGSLPATLTNQDLLAGVADVGQAFNIFDNMVLAQEKIDTMSAASNTHTLVTAYWYDGRSYDVCETCYVSSGGVHSIYLLGSASDNDAYDDTIILHEMGHYVAQVYSRDDSPGGSHTITGHYNLRLSWSEGWATFFGSLVRALKTPPAATPELYVDTLTAATLGFSFEIESMTTNGSSISASAKGADNEVAVSAVLWDIYDTNNEGAWDTLTLGYDEIWQLFDVDIAAASIATFETFWDEWEANYTPGQLDPLMATNGRDIRYSADADESAPGDNTAANANPIGALPASEDHTFFGASDTDWFSIDVTNGWQYTFKTENLGDGADTLLTLYASDKTTPIAQDDDDETISCTAGSAIICLASKIVWRANVTNTVYLLAEPYRPLTPGELDYDPPSPAAVTKYGYYTLTVTSP